ncbi:MAG: hypothetical protein ACREIU_04545, partial [Planctomycetota bacterium]
MIRKPERASLGRARAARDPGDPASFLRRHKVVTLTRSAWVPSVVEALAGGNVRGSWWGHPAGRRIYAFASALAASPEVLTTKLVDGKVTFVHRALWPALLRVVTDPGWRAIAERGLTPPARRLLEAVERAGELRLDRWDAGRPLGKRALAAARLELERAALVLGTEIHTEKGSHEIALRSWSRFADRPLRAEAARLSFAEALGAIRKACRGLPSSVEAGVRGRSGGSG